MEEPTTPEENRDRVYKLAERTGVPMPTDSQRTHGKGSPEGFIFVTNISDPPETDSYMGFESETEFMARMKSELGDDVRFTTPAFDKDGLPWRGTAVHVRAGVSFVMHKPTEGN